MTKLIKEEKYQEALSRHESLFDEKHAADWYTKGNLLGNLGKLEESLECYNKTISIDPDYVKSWYRKGNLLHMLNKNLESAKCFERVFEIEQRKIKQRHLDSWEWSYAAGFYCMMVYIIEYNSYVINKRKIPDEIYKKTNLWEKKMNMFLEQNKTIPKFNDETKFVDHCHENFESILNTLEPKIVAEFRLENKKSEKIRKIFEKLSKKKLPMIMQCWSCKEFFDSNNVKWVPREARLPIGDDSDNPIFTIPTGLVAFSNTVFGYEQYEMIGECPKCKSRINCLLLGIENPELTHISIECPDCHKSFLRESVPWYSYRFKAELDVKLEKKMVCVCPFCRVEIRYMNYKPNDRIIAE